MGEIGIDDAYRIYDEIMDRFHNGNLNVFPREELCMDNFEWTAFAHGASLETIADWRKNGWPKTCANCDQTLDYKKYGWRIEADRLRCIKCIE